MAYIKKFESDNNKYTNKSSRVNVNNPDFNPSVAVNGKKENSLFDKKQKQWADLVAYYR